MGKLHEDTRLERRDGKLVAVLSRDWEIWGPNGGYVASIALRAGGMIAPAGHRPATISVQYLAVADFGEVVAEVEPVRQGRSAWCLNVALVQSGKRFLQAQVWTTNRTDGPSSAEHVMPDVPGPDGLKSVEELLPKDAPRSKFWANIESRPTHWIPRGESEPRGAMQEQWFRFPGFESGGDPFAAAMPPLLLIDTLFWPAWHRVARNDESYIAPTLDVTAWFHDLPRDDSWILMDVRAGTAGGGLIHGVARAWAPDGRLLATGGSNLLVTPSRR
jgi:acyl-CoA thioesterase II